MVTPKKGTTKDLPDQVKKFDASSVSYKSRLQLVKRILVNMKAQSGTVSAAGVLLAGDPGVGKTSFIRFLSELFGLKLVVLEVPHITEEHIINIPYIRYNPATNKTTREVIEGEQKSDFDLVLAESNLYSILKNSKPISEKEYMKSLYAADSSMTNVRRVFEALGGSKGVIPAPIQYVREHFTTILFLDEFFRKTSVSIRNMLRGLLNKDLGLSRLPAHVYPVYASNIDDDGVEEIPSNNQFNVIEMKAPEKDSWFGYVTDKAHDHGLEIKEEVLNKLYSVIQPEWLSYHDKDAGVNISPRRWEQLLFYIDASLPLPSKKGEQARYGKALMTNIKENFTNYQTGKVSSIAAPILNAVSELISEFNNVTVTPSDTYKTYEWRETLRHQIYRKIQLDDLRKYIPVISGPPGVGKTSVMYSIAAGLKLGLIKIDCSTLSYEGVMGTPLSAKDKFGNTTTIFSDSQLYKWIMQKAEENPPKKEYANGYKYIIFFDELNRTNVKTFNGLRKLILEKEFDNGKKLPEKSIVVAAINPEDSGGGVTELTKHMVDVLDIINVTPNWISTVAWLDGKKEELGLDFEDIADGVIDVIKVFAERFKNATATDVEPHFSLQVGGDESVYISPREYAQIFTEGSLALDMELQEALDEFDMSYIDPKSEHVREIDRRLRETLFQSFAGVLRGIFIKASLDSPKFMETLEAWFMADQDASPIRNLISFEGTSSKLSVLLEEAINDPSEPLAENIEMSQKLEKSLESMNIQVFKEELFEFFDNIVSKSGTAGFAEVKYPFRTYDNGKIKTTSEKVSVFNYIIKELFITIKANSISNEFIEVLSMMTVDYLCEHLVNKNDLDEHVEYVIAEASTKLGI